MAEAKSVLKSKAAAIKANLDQVGAVGFDPLTILAIITALIQLFAGCSLTPARAKRVAANPTRLQQVVLKRLIRQHAPGQDQEALLAALLDAGDEVTIPELTALADEVEPAE